LLSCSGCREKKEYIDAIGVAVMTPQPKPVLPWLLRIIEELRIVESTNDAERNATTHDGWPWSCCWLVFEAVG